MNDNHMTLMTEQKKKLRAEMKNKLREFCGTSMYGMTSHEAARNFLNSQAYKDARLVMAFVSLQTEIETRGLIEEMLGDGKNVAVPVVDGPDMIFRLLRKDIPLPEQLIKGFYNIEEPSPALDAADPENLPEDTVMLVPGLAFSQAGARLGKGKGFYDRYIDRIRAACIKTGRRMPLLAGFGFSFQLMDQVPAEPHDQPLDLVITEKGLFPVC